MAGDEARVSRIYGSVLGVSKSESKAVATVRTVVASIDTRIEWEHITMEFIVGLPHTPQELMLFV